MANTSNGFNRWLWIGGALVVGYLIARWTQQKTQDVVGKTSDAAGATSQVADATSQALTTKPQVIQGQVRLPPPPATQQELSELIRAVQQAPPQPIRIIGGTPEEARRVAQEIYVPFQQQVQEMIRIIGGAPTQVSIVTSPMESELPPPPPGQYFSYTRSGQVEYWASPPAIVIGSSGAEMPPPPPPG
jgi:hypothetical protein